MQGKNRRRMPGIMKAAMLLFAIWASVSFMQTQLKINDKKAQLQDLNMQIQESTVKNGALRQNVEEGASDEYIASIAREKLGYAYPNERKFVDASSK